MLLIAGFRHSAFTFGCESMVAKSNINGAKIPPGELINLIQKGVLYTELEKTVTDDGGLVDDDPEPFSLVTRDLPSIEAKARGDAADASSSRAAPAKRHHEPSRRPGRPGVRRGDGHGVVGGGSGCGGGAHAAQTQAQTETRRYNTYTLAVRVPRH